MIDAKRKKEAQQNFAQYLQDGLIKREVGEFMLEMKKLSLKQTFKSSN